MNTTHKEQWVVLTKNTVPPPHSFGTLLWNKFFLAIRTPGQQIKIQAKLQAKSTVTLWMNAKPANTHQCQKQYKENQSTSANYINACNNQSMPSWSLLRKLHKSIKLINDLSYTQVPSSNSVFYSQVTPAKLSEGNNVPTLFSWQVEFKWLDWPHLLNTLFYWRGSQHING